MAKALIKAIYVDVVSTVLATGCANLEGSDVEPGSILEVVTSKLEKSTGLNAAHLCQLAIESAGSRLRAVIQADIELTRALVSAAQRKAA